MTSIVKGSIPIAALKTRLFRAVITWKASNHQRRVKLVVSTGIEVRNASTPRAQRAVIVSLR